MNSDTGVPRAQILRAEFQVIMDKEIEMRELYSKILERVENNYVHEKIRTIRDDEVRHIGYVEIMMSLLGLEQKG